MLETATLVGLLAASQLTTSPDARCPGDAFEPNDTCAQAAVLGLGSHPGLTADSGFNVPESDWYRFDVPAATSFEIGISVANPGAVALGIVNIWRSDPTGGNCDLIGTGLPSGCTSASTTIHWDAPADTGATYYLDIYFFGDGACIEYDLSLAFAPNACLAVADTGIEDNDTCMTAAPLAVGAYPGQRVSIADPDFYEVTAAPGELLTVVVTEPTANAAFGVTAWDSAAACSGAIVAAAADTLGAAEVGFYLFNDGPAPRSWTFEVQPDLDTTTGTGGCFDYGLEILAEGGLCTPDALEPNNDCATAPTITSGTYTGLNIRPGDHENLFVDVPAGARLRAASTSTTPGGRSPMHLHASCAQFSFLTSSQWNAGVERLEWTNAASTPAQVRLLLWSAGNLGYPGPFCSTYDLSIEFVHGEVSCLSHPNSTGFRARLEAVGSSTVGVGTTILRTERLPAGQFGLTFFGFAPQAPIALGDGLLCVDAPLHRLPVGSTGDGNLETVIDWSSPGDAGVIAAGQWVHFQTWFRDPTVGGAGSNVSNGLRVMFD